MKKILSLLLAVMMLFGCIPAMAEDNPEWEINEFTGLVSRESAAEKLESIDVPAEVNGIAVRGIEYMAFNMHKNFKQLTIADSAVMLDRRVLRDLLKLEVLDLPESLLIIREGNFTNLPKLTSVVIPASVVLVHSSFNKCESLTSITFEGMCPIFVTEGSFGMFTDLPADCVIYVPDNQVNAYKEAFADREDVLARIQPSGKNAERIERFASESDFVFDASTGTITGYTGSADYLELPATIGGVQVKHIADYAFETNVCCIVIPEGVETVGKYSLGRELLSYVSLPSTLTNVGTGAFASSYVSVISYNAADVPAYEAAAFEAIKSAAWQLLLPYGSSQELVDAFAAYIAAGAPKAVVKASIIEPYSFPELDVEAGAPYIGNWTAVAVDDGTDFYGMDLLGISMTAILQDDGTGVVDMDGDAAPGGWYVEDGAAIFAPILEEGGQPVLEEAMPFTLDENARMCLDLGGLILLMEKEGAEYATPAIPEKPWPELDAEKAKSYIGMWDAVSYIVDGETISAELVGPMTLILNDDGTAQMIEGEEEAYELRWYAESYSAYAGPTMSTAVELFFDMNGNLQMMQDGSKVVFAPHVDVKVIEGADELLGEWLDDIGNKLTITNDGTLTHTYASDGWVDTYTWDMVDGAAAVTSGNWEGASIYMRDGIVFVDNDEGIFQLFSADGDLSAYYGEEEEYELPEAQPIGDEGEPYFGAWQCELMPGMAMVLTLNQDGTCTMDMMGEAEPGVWTMENGRAYVMGDEVVIDGDGNLVMESQGMVFVKAEGATEAGSETAEDDDMAMLMAMLGAMEDGTEAADPDEMSDEEAMMLLMAMLGAVEEQEELAAESVDPYIGVKFEMTGSIVQGMVLTAEQLGCAGDYVIFNADGSAKLVMGGIDVQTLGWKRGAVTVLGEEYEDGFSIDYYGTYYNFAITEEGLLLDYFGMLRTYERADGESAPSAAAPVADPYVDKKFLCTGSIVQGMKLSAEQLGCAGDYVIFNADGSAELVMSGIPVQTLGWTRGTVNVAGVEYEGFAVDYYGTIYNFATTEDGLLLDYFGMVRTYEAE